MIVDPFANHLDPPGLGWAHYREISVTGANTKCGEANVRGGASSNMEDRPPPYTEMDLERGIIEGLGTPRSIHSRFLGMDEGGTNAYSGMQHIKEGTQIFYNSIMFFTGTSLLTLGICIEGFGKILCGIGMIMKRHRTLCHPIPDN